MASRMYESDITRLLREVGSKPEVEKSRREGRSIFWDRKLDLGLMKRLEDSELPTPGYVYYELSGPDARKDASRP